MNLMLIAWRNVGRNRRRSLLSISAVAAACAALMFSMALQKGSYADMILNAVNASSGHLQIQHEEYFENQELARHVQRVDQLLALLDAEEGLGLYTPRIRAAALAGSGDRTFGAMVLGIDPLREAGVSRLAKVVVEGEFLADPSSHEAVLGDALARNLQAKLGDEVVLLGQGADGSLAAVRLVVRGIFRFGNNDMDRTLLAAPLDVIREAYSMPDAATEIAFLLDKDERRPGVTRCLQALLHEHGYSESAVLGWPDILPGIEQSIQIDWVGGLIMYAVLALVVGFGIGNTFLMAFMERIRECGVMLSLGMRPLMLSALLYLESILLTVTGLILGVLLGTPLVLYFQVRGISFGEEGGKMLQEYGMSPVIHPLLVPGVFSWALGIVAGVAVLAAIYPALKASGLKPVEALHHS